MRQKWCVIYRTGGTENLCWHRSLAFIDKRTAITRQRELERAGYPAFVENYDLSMATGLPDKS